MSKSKLIHIANFTDFKSRLTTAWNILTGKHKRWILLSIEIDDLVNMLYDEDADILIHHHGLNEYLYRLMLKHVAECIPFEDMVIYKAQFQLQIEELLELKRIQKQQNQNENEDI